MQVEPSAWFIAHEEWKTEEKWGAKILSWMGLTMKEKLYEKNTGHKKPSPGKSSLCE